MPSDKSPAKLGLRIVLFLILGIALVALFVDRRARGVSDDANVLLNNKDQQGATLNLDTVHELLEREPTSSTEAGAGVIEHYQYAGGLPGRSYTLRVAYFKNPEGSLTYVGHNLNDQEGDNELQQLIDGYGIRMFMSEDAGSDLGGGPPGGAGAFSGDEPEQSK